MTETLATRLVSGGDHRLALHNGVNAYGCPPLADPQLAALGACTASPISLAAQQVVTHLDTTLPMGAPLENLWPRLLADWLAACELPPETGIYPSPSGTDLHGEWLQHMRQQHPEKALHVVSFAAGETGRGVPTQLASAASVTLVALRDAAGLARPASAVDDDYQRGVDAAQQAGAHCLVITSDLSKTGLQAPSAALLADLADRSLRGEVSLFIDACQFRCAPATLRDYLAQGAWVALTGSKFISGPSFSAQLLHANRASLPAVAPNNPGLLLRMAAALFELQRWRVIPARFKTEALLAFAQTVETGFQSCRHLHALPNPPLQRARPDWDAIPSIFLFQYLGNPQQGSVSWHQAFRQRVLSATAEQRIFLGQAVELAPGQAALRLCSSARWVVEAQEKGLDRACAELAGQIAHLDRQAELAITG